MNALIICRMWLLKKIAGDMGVILNVKEVNFKPLYKGQSIYGDNIIMKIKESNNE